MPHARFVSATSGRSKRQISQTLHRPDRRSSSAVQGQEAVVKVGKGTGAEETAATAVEDLAATNAVSGAATDVTVAADNDTCSSAGPVVVDMTSRPTHAHTCSSAGPVVVDMTIM